MGLSRTLNLYVYNFPQKNLYFCRDDTKLEILSHHAAVEVNDIGEEVIVGLRRGMVDNLALG